MSGHSKWANIKNRKAAVDQKKGKTFSKLARIITVAAKEKGDDLSMNPRLRTVIEKAKAANMPQDNIEKAVKKGIGQLESAVLEEFTYEAYGPGNAAIIIEGITDNKNRSFSEIKHLLNRHGGKMADSGSVLWMFEKIGKIFIQSPQNREGVELTAIDAGAEDIKNDNTNITIYVKPENIYEMKAALETKNIKIESAELEWKEKDNLKIPDEQTKINLKKLLEALNEHDDIQTIYHNVKF